MKLYRFLGTVSEIDGYPKLSRFGQIVELPEELAKEAVLGNCPIIEESDFKKLGFTDKELADYPYVGSHADASPAFLAKKRSALDRLHAVRGSLENPPVKTKQIEGGE